MRALLTLTLLAVPTAGQAQPDVFCEDVRRVAAGAEESPPFASLRAVNFEPRLLAGNCFFSDSGGYTCGQSLVPAELTKETVAARIQACLPGATLTVERTYLLDQRVVRLGRFSATVMEHGGPRAHVGRIINIYIAAERANPSR